MCSATVDGQWTNWEVGALWSEGSMWVDGQQTNNVSLVSQLPTDVWFHLHVEAGWAFTAPSSVAVLAPLSSPSPMGLAGKVAQMALWAEPLTHTVVSPNPNPNPRP